MPPPGPPGSASARSPFRQFLIRSSWPNCRLTPPVGVVEAAVALHVQAAQFCRRNSLQQALQLGPEPGINPPAAQRLDAPVGGCGASSRHWPKKISGSPLFAKPEQAGKGGSKEAAMCSAPGCLSLTPATLAAGRHIATDRRSILDARPGGFVEQAMIQESPAAFIFLPCTRPTPRPRAWPISRSIGLHPLGAG